MDLRDATITALTKATTEREALDLLIEQQPMSVYEARRALGEAVVSLGWALLVAPELYLCLCAWWRIQRLSEDLRIARKARRIVMKGLKKWDPAEVIGELAKDEEGKIEVRISGDILSARSGGFSKIADTITKAEGALERAEERLQVAVRRYQRTLEDITTLSPQEQAARLMRLACQDGHYEVARALLTFKDEGNDPASTKTPEEIARRIEELNAKRQQGTP